MGERRRALGGVVCFSDCDSLSWGVAIPSGRVLCKDLGWAFLCMILCGKVF